MMDNIVRFKRPMQASKRTSDGRPDKHGAEIILFPGIRYEYWDGACQSRTDADPVLPRRDTIEL